MTLSLYRRESLLMRSISVLVALTFTLSLAGPGFASPSVSETGEESSPVIEAPEKGADEGKEEQSKDQEPKPSVEADPTTAEPDSGEKRERDTESIETEAGDEGEPSKEPELAPASVSVMSTAPYATFQNADWQAWRVSPTAAVGWQKSNLGNYREGDWIPVRVFVNNTSGTEDVRFPGFHTAWDYLNTSKNAIAIDGARDFRFYASAGGSLPGDQPYPAGAQDISSYFSEYVGPGTTYYNVEMATPSSDLIVPAGRYGIVYFQVHLALTPYWEAQSPARLGAKEYPGSSAQGRFISWNGAGVGQNTLSVPVGTQVTPKGEIRGVKFHDLNRDGVKQENEPGLSGWEFTLNYLGEFPFTVTTTSGAGGVFTFTELPVGDYSLNETPQSPWMNSTPLPMSISLARDEIRPITVGNYVPDVVKTWSLSIDALPMSGVPFVRYSVNSAASVTSTLTGSGPYTAQINVPVGSTISNIGWYMMYGGEEVLLGTMADETLNANKTNSFTYDSSVSGRKFDAGTEEGLSGWTIVLKRVANSVETTYAQAITGSDGAYSFADVIPGTYAVYEVLQPGWLQTAAPVGTFTVSNGSLVTGKDFGNLFIQSSISIDKSGPALAHVGDEIMYTIVVTNTGNFALTNVTITDPLLGLNSNIGSLAAGASHTTTATRTILADDPDPLPNTASVMGSPILGAPVMGSDDHLVDILKPAISVTKTAAPTMAVNPSLVEYEYVVTNSGEDTLTAVSLGDDKLSVPGDAIGTLAPGQSVTLTAEATLTVTTTNTASVRGEDALGLEVTDTDDARVQIFNPAIDIVKSASSTVVLPGGLVSYSYLVTNIGDIALFDISVTDDKLGPVDTIPMLAPGAFDTVSISTTLSVDTTNVGTATGWFGTPETEFYGSVSDTDPESVIVVSPSVSIDKSGAPNPVLTGRTVTYTYVVANTGDVVLYDLVVTDDKLGEIGTIAMLAVGQSSTLTTDTVLTETTDNVGEVTGRDQYQHPVFDSDDETVEVFDPKISIVKTVDRERVVVGDSVVYSFLVTNEGDIDLHDVVITDDILGLIGTIDHLPMGESETLTKGAVISADVINVGTVEGTYGDSEGEFNGSVTATDSAEVDAISPSFTVEKSAAPSPVIAGTTVVYTFLVTNTGDAPLYDFEINDDHLGPVGTITELGIGASTEVTASADLTMTTTNVVVVDASDEFENPYSDTDTETVEVFNPAIDIVKTSSSNVVLAGTPVTYTYLVTNSGDIALFNIEVDDDVLGLIGTIPALAPGASDTVSITTTITADVTNIGTAEGWYGVPETDFFGSVSSNDPESVDVVAPAIGVVKSATPDEIVAGESVTYTYVVSNLGDVDLFDIVLDDDKLGIVGNLDSLAVGASATFTAAATLSEPTTNVVVATAVDAVGHEVSASDDAFVDVALPFTGSADMTIKKSADKSRASAGESVVYTLTYENVGDDDAFDITIVDDFDERYMTVIDAGGGTVADGRITWKIPGPVSPDDGPQTITYRVRIANDLPASVSAIDNVVVISSPDDDDPSNNRAEWRVLIDDPFLPFTGGELVLLVLGMVVAIALGFSFRRFASVEVS